MADPKRGTKWIPDVSAMFLTERSGNSTGFDPGYGTDVACKLGTPCGDTPKIQWFLIFPWITSILDKHGLTNQLRWWSNPTKCFSQVIFGKSSRSTIFVIRGSENPNPVNRWGVHGYVNGDTDVKPCKTTYVTFIMLYQCGENKDMPRHAHVSLEMGGINPDPPTPNLEGLLQVPWP